MVKKEKKVKKRRILVFIVVVLKVEFKNIILNGSREGFSNGVAHLKVIVGYRLSGRTHDISR